MLPEIPTNGLPSQSSVSPGASPITRICGILEGIGPGEKLEENTKDSHPETDEECDEPPPYEDWDGVVTEELFELCPVLRKCLVACRLATTWGLIGFCRK